MEFSTRNLLASVVLVLALTGPSLSQTTGTVTGRAMDDSGESLAGVKVRLAGPSLIGGARTITTSLLGAYRFTELPGGTFTVTLVLPGFKTLEIRDVRVKIGAIARVNGTLEATTAPAIITSLSQGPALDLEQATVGVNFDGRVFDEIPYRRRLAGLITMIPGMSDGSEVYGRPGDNQIFVDGMMWGQLAADHGSFEQVRVNLAAKSAEFSNPGATISFVTKSGGNNFHGNVVADWDNDSFMSNNVDQDLLDQGISGRPNRDFTNTDFAAEIGGPILKERAWFFASYRQASHSLVLDGFVDDRNGAEPQDYLNRLQDPALKLTWQVNDNNRLETAAQFGRSWVPYSRGSAFTPLTATQNRDTWSAVGPTLKWTFLVSPTMTFDAAIRRGGYWRRSDAWTDAVRMRDSGQIRGGALESAERPVRWQWDANYSVFTDIGGTSHQVKTGYTGSWGYSTATEIFGYTNQQVYRYRSRRFGDDLFSNPDSVFVYDYPSFVKNGESYDAWFITDRINLKRNLTLSFGFRWDRYSSWLPEQGNPGTGPFATKAIRPARGPEEFPIYNSWSPRLSLVYDVTGQGRIALKTSYGRYAGSGSGPGILPGAGAGSINPVPTGGQKRYCAVGNCSSSVPDEAAWAGEIPYTPDQRALISIRGTERPMFNSLADDLKTPFTPVRKIESSHRRCSIDPVETTLQGIGRSITVSGSTFSRRPADRWWAIFRKIRQNANRRSSTLSYRTKPTQMSCSASTPVETTLQGPSMTAWSRSGRCRGTIRTSERISSTSSSQSGLKGRTPTPGTSSRSAGGRPTDGGLCFPTPPITGRSGPTTPRIRTICCMSTRSRFLSGTAS